MDIFVAFILALISMLLLGLGALLIKWVAMQIGVLTFVCVFAALFIAFVIALGEE